MRPLVFLDMDDVLCLNEQHTSTLMLERFQKEDLECPAMWLGLLDPDAAANLQCLHEEFLPFYVVSSSWVIYLNLQQMCELFKRTGLHFVLENLHERWQTPRALSSSRREEVEWWLHEHREPGQPFVILDDTSSGWSLAHSPLDHDGHVILCKVKRGFTLEKLNEARRLLGRQIYSETKG
jgi:hypothetical protein